MPVNLLLNLLHDWVINSGAAVPRNMFDSLRSLPLMPVIRFRYILSIPDAGTCKVLG